MSMEEKHEGIWINVEEDGAAKIIFKNYLSDIDKLQVIYQQVDGSFIPYSYAKVQDPQWRLPIWSKENEKAMMPTIESAKEYLANYAASNT